MSQRKPNSFRPEVTLLENREVPSIASVQLVGGILNVTCNNVSSNVLVNQNSATINVRDLLTNRVWQFNPASVSEIHVKGGNGNDNLSATTNHPATAKLVTLTDGNGNDTLTGYAGPVSMKAGSGTDKLISLAGDDTLIGGSGNDTLQGGSGDCSLVAGTGNDYLNAGTGLATIVGGIGNDTIVSINGHVNDTIYVGIGPATLWVDSIDGVTDTIVGDTSNDVVQAVSGFANPGASLILNGAKIPEPLPLPGNQLEPFTNRPLFASGGPTAADVKQYINPKLAAMVPPGGVGGTGTLLDDSWLLAGLGAIAQQDPAVIEQNVVDFGDGTYGVKLDGNFYRVDNELPVTSPGVTFAAYASVGLQNSMWVPIVEKAFTYLETPTSTPNYAALTVAANKSTPDVFTAFGSTNASTNALNGATGFTNASALGQAIESLVNDGSSAAIGVTTGAPGANLINGREYTIIGYNLDLHGNVAAVILRNPMGIDGGGSADNNPKDGIVTVSIANLFATTGTLDFGDV